MTGQSLYRLRSFANERRVNLNDCWDCPKNQDSELIVRDGDGPRSHCGRLHRHRCFSIVIRIQHRFISGALSVIEEATYSGILLPGNEWKALSYPGRTARMAYRVRVRCDRNYYGQTCTKLCKPRDDRFGHYTCGDTDGRKECIPGWQGETCDKGD